jgi:hypothetical protein
MAILSGLTILYIFLFFLIIIYLLLFFKIILKKKELREGKNGD